MKSLIIDALEALYHVRLGLESSKGARGDAAKIMKMGLQSAEISLKAGLESKGVTVGITSNDADKAKLAVMNSPSEEGDRVIEVEKVIKTHEIHKVPVDRVQTALEEAAMVSGCGCELLHREVHRFAIFVSQAVFCRPGGSLVRKDDPDLPVYPWLEARCGGHAPTNDVAAMAELYVEWSRQVCQIYEDKRKDA